MRHGKKKYKLGVSGPHRSALMANLSVALITHGQIRTTLAKAKALRPFVEKVITLAKKAESTSDTSRKLHFRRLAISRVRDESAVALLFSERVKEFMERPGGYTRIYKLGQRIGDAAEMALIELIDGNDEGYAKKPSKKTAKKANAEPVEKNDEEEPVNVETTEVVAAESDASSEKAPDEESPDVDAQEELVSDEEKSDSDEKSETDADEVKKDG